MSPGPTITTEACDVLILGGGPAGSAVALSLRQHAPSLSVVMIEKTRVVERRLGETLPPLARTLLEHLDLWSAFRDQNHREFFGTSAAWGSPIAQENSYLFLNHGSGWHLDRARFDGMLAAEAERRGVRVVRGKLLEQAVRDGPLWRLRLAGRGTLTARFVVDATGRSAAFARRQGSTIATIDRLVAFAGFFQERSGSDPGTLVEALPEGWWYTSGLPGGRRLFACLTDHDIGRHLRLSDPATWSRQLGETTHLAPLAREAVLSEPLMIRPAESRYLEPAVGDGWLAVGDAASVFDPLSSQGIAKALRSGIFASYAMTDLLVKGDASGLDRYRRLVRDEFESFLKVRRQYYQQEQRWPESAFWRRRRERIDTAQSRFPGFL